MITSIVKISNVVLNPRIIFTSLKSNDYDNYSHLDSML
ncbi:hypothetical protein DSOL_0875 [Desulfosporosinus metallidurans]|uniref:Uncharacterized protein n=1 Tax=Desulfosporosinus metallidurans TaxID=1888891 RepID=A0A1Q8R0J2_9FIRM|nr:hypothetical protein DSOL_0875 [Desulfosporosinus metallidurans]